MRRAEHLNKHNIQIWESKIDLTSITFTYLKHFEEEMYFSVILGP